MIVKIQWPLGGDMGNCLIYSEDRTWQSHPPVKWFKDVYDPSKPKKFFNAKHHEDGVLELFDELPDQGW